MQFLPFFKAGRCLAGCLLLTLVLLQGCDGRRIEPQPIIKRVIVEEVRLSDSLLAVHYYGRLKEAAEIGLGFRLAGSIAEVLVSEGEFVTQGQLIARLDSRDYEIQLQAARAQYRQVKAEAERVIELFARQSVSENEYDKAVAGLHMVEAQLKRASDQMDDTRLVAPVSGFVQRLNFRAHELIDAGMPLVQLIGQGAMHIEVDIPAWLFLARDNIMSVSARRPGSSGESLMLKPMHVSHKASSNQLFRQYLTAAGPLPAGWAAGMGLEVDFLLQREGAAYLDVPLSAVFVQDGQEHVWVFDAASGRVLARRIKTHGAARSGRLMVAEGLRQGEQLVVAGVHALTEQQRVHPIEALSDTNVGGLL